MPHSGWQRFLVNDFKVNPPRPASLLIIDNIAHGCIGVGPPTAEVVAPELMGRRNSRPAASSICRVRVPRIKCSHRVLPGNLSTQTVFAPDGRTRKRSPLSI